MASKVSYRALGPLVLGIALLAAGLLAAEPAAAQSAPTATSTPTQTVTPTQTITPTQTPTVTPSAGDSLSQVLVTNSTWSPSATVTGTGSTQLILGTTGQLAPGLYTIQISGAG